MWIVYNVICEEWFHSICEALTPIEEISIGEYTCVNCSGLEDRLDIFTEKINKLVDEEDILNQEIIQLREMCDNLKST